jgi:lactoylglutathione lyase
MFSTMALLSRRHFTAALLSTIVALPASSALTTVGIRQTRPLLLSSLKTRQGTLWTTSRLNMSNTAGLAPVIPGRPTWQQTMLRIKDPEKSLPFYTQLLGFTLIDKLDFPQYKFSLYFLTTLPPGETYSLTPGTQAAHDYLWSMEGVALELTHNHGTESDESFAGYHGGNQEKGGLWVGC